MDEGGVLNADWILWVLPFVAGVVLAPFVSWAYARVRGG